MPKAKIEEISDEYQMPIKLDGFVYEINNKSTSYPVYCDSPVKRARPRHLFSILFTRGTMVKPAHDEIQKTWLDYE
jgi:hypothetical protein